PAPTAGRTERPSGAPSGPAARCDAGARARSRSRPTRDAPRGALTSLRAAASFRRSARRAPLLPTRHMSVPLLDLRAQFATIRDDVDAAMRRVVDDQAFILGAPVADLERQVAELSRTRYAIGCASGTDALLLALRALDA